MPMRRPERRGLCEANEFEILIPETVLRELEESPYHGVPDWIPSTILSDSNAQRPTS